MRPNIKMQKTGAEASAYTKVLPASDLERHIWKCAPRPGITEHVISTGLLVL